MNRAQYPKKRGVLGHIGTLAGLEDNNELGEHRGCDIREYIQDCDLASPTPRVSPTAFINIDAQRSEDFEGGYNR